MMWVAVGASVWAWLVGIVCVTALWPRGRSWRAEGGLIISLGLGAGLGVTSACFFAGSLLSSRPALASAILELLVAAGAGAALWRRRGNAAPPSGVRAKSGSWLTVILGTAFAQACVVALVVAVRAYHAEPYSNSDGWTIWNMHARLLFRGGTAWPDLLQRPQLAWTHLDYPLLVPASVARVWAYAGQDAPFGSGLVSTLFGVATVGVLVSAAARLRSAAVALAGGLVLVGTPFFVTFSSNQHADIPLGLYILATLAVATLARGEPKPGGLAVLAGAMAGLAAWTKNEGWLFVAVAGGTWLAAELARGSWRCAGSFIAGLAVALLPVAVFKSALAPANDLLASDPIARWPHLFDWTRHRLILSSLARDLWRFGEWSIVPFAAMVLPLLGPRSQRLGRREWDVAVVLGLMLAGYYGVYLLTHWDLGAHVDSSLVRLLLQLWPAAVFLWCLAIPYHPAEAAPSGTGHRLWRPGIAVIANVAIAAVVVGALQRQPAANELAAARLGDTRIRVLLGEGWFGREMHGRDVWSWSKGESTLLLPLDGSAKRNVKLRFTVRGLGDRTVAVRNGNRVLWQSRVREEAQTIEISGLELSPGMTTLVFASDAPGVPESTAPGARPLTFAVYNPVIQ